MLITFTNKTQVSSTSALELFHSVYQFQFLSSAVTALLTYNFRCIHAGSVSVSETVTSNANATGHTATTGET